MFIKLDTEREIRIRNKALSQIEKKLKRSFTTIMTDITDLYVEDQIFILYQGLRHEDPQLTLDKVTDLVDEYSDMKTVIEAITKASLDAYGIKEEDLESIEEGDDEENPNQAAMKA